MSSVDPFDTIRAELAKLERERLGGPGLHRCVPPASPDDQRKLDAKHEARRRIKALWPDLSQRRVAVTKLGIDEATLRGQLDPRQMNREPSAKVLELLEYHEQIARLARKIGEAV
jgi:hypothetical protein